MPDMASAILNNAVATVPDPAIRILTPFELLVVFLLHLNFIFIPIELFFIWRLERDRQNQHPATVAHYKAAKGAGTVVFIGFAICCAIIKYRYFAGYTQPL
ncbi:uncharacterized protein K452DRAFT_312011 [Aplosporella prunicola CBS 121167]|uniref:Uncharacterized protein n=1 Tax=Aplosporella prunicola CBS 121167 TaxID=1176127 RepID=A0A6A6B110_9PEZI|nr:uncharacterized protein K452DRAFT_312011 [Aplosporella prunicola CBS 121167]KAF2137872.1 hypothetical protein K452DRAFT_312011 [Aplosporella prunicola CBS 121167]